MSDEDCKITIIHYYLDGGEIFQPFVLRFHRIFPGSLVEHRVSINEVGAIRDIPLKVVRYNFLVIYREKRNEYIRAKYIDKKFTIRTCSDDNDLENDIRMALSNGDLLQLLQAYAEGADFSQPFSSQVSNSEILLIKQCFNFELPLRR